MKKLLLIVLLIVGCKKTSTSAPSCEELNQGYLANYTQWAEDLFNQGLCEATLTSYQAVIDYNCSPFFTEAGATAIQEQCNLLSDG